MKKEITVDEISLKLLRHREYHREYHRRLVSLETPDQRKERLERKRALRLLRPPYKIPPDKKETAKIYSRNYKRMQQNDPVWREKRNIKQKEIRVMAGIEVSRKYRKKYKESHRNRMVLVDCQYRWKYGISAIDVIRLWEAQCRVCAICNTEISEISLGCVDHCHNSKKIRGFICRGCNSGLGHFKDNVLFMNEACGYLKKTTTCGFVSDNEYNYYRFHRKAVMFNNLIALLGNQDYRCAICGVPIITIKCGHVDHSHVTGKVRGILCRSCNVGLGFFKENVSLIKKAINYIERTK